MKDEKGYMRCAKHLQNVHVQSVSMFVRVLSDTGFRVYENVCAQFYGKRVAVQNSSGKRLCLLGTNKTIYEDGCRTVEANV